MADRHQVEQLLQHWDAMVRACRRILGSQADAQDCAASAVLQLLQERPAQVAGTQTQLVALAERRARDEDRGVPGDRFARNRSAVHDQDSEVADAAEADRRAQARDQLAPATFELLELLSRGREIRTAADELGISLRAEGGSRPPADLPGGREDAVAQDEISGLRGLIRRSAATAAPAAVLGLVVLVGVVASQGATPPGPPPSVQQLSPVDEAEVRPAPAARVRQQSPARAATRGARSVERRSAPRRQAVAPARSQPGVAGAPSVAADDVTPDEDERHYGDPVNELEDCVEEILTTPGDVGC